MFIVGTEIDTTPGREGQLERLNTTTNNKIDRKTMATYFSTIVKNVNTAYENKTKNSVMQLQTRIKVVMGGLMTIQQSSLIIDENNTFEDTLFQEAGWAVPVLHTSAEFMKKQK